MLYQLQALFNEARIMYSELVGMGEESTVVIFKILISAYARSEKDHRQINKGYLMHHSQVMTSHMQDIIIIINAEPKMLSVKELYESGLF
jgi:hypothetical protein